MPSHTTFGLLLLISGYVTVHLLLLFSPTTHTTKQPIYFYHHSASDLASLTARLDALVAELAADQAQWSDLTDVSTLPLLIHITRHVQSEGTLAVADTAILSSTLSLRRRKSLLHILFSSKSARTEFAGAIRQCWEVDQRLQTLGLIQAQWMREVDREMAKKVDGWRYILGSFLGLERGEWRSKLADSRAAMRVWHRGVAYADVHDVCEAIGRVGRRDGLA